MKVTSPVGCAWVALGIKTEPTLRPVDGHLPARPLIVIEVNDFPNYTGIAGADQRLARFAESAVGRNLVVVS